jgi:YVTN family beta-propeller protein
VPNVFKGEGVAGSISIMDLDRFEVVREITGPAILMPVAAGIKGSSKAYVANIVSGQVTVIDLGTQQIVKNIPVTLTPDCRSGAQFSIFDTLQAPIQTPVSPDGRYVGVAVLSLTTVDRACTGSPDHVTIIDTATDTVVAPVGTSLRNSAGTHGANWGAKRGGGYYLHVANHLGVVDPDPNGDRNGTDATLVGRVLLGTGPDVTDGVGGQASSRLRAPVARAHWQFARLGAGLWRFVAACTALVRRPARAWLPPPRAQPSSRLLPRRGAARVVLGIRLRRVSWMTADGVASAALAFLLLGGV